MAVIRALLFDADGVLQRATGDLHARLHAALGFELAATQDFVRDVSAAEWPALTGDGDFVDALGPVVRRWGAAGAAEKVAACWTSIEVDAAIVGLVAELRRNGYFCALATNQERRRGTHMAEALGYAALFDRSFYSYALGCRKPDAAYFHAMIRDLPFAPGEMLFIDDRGPNVAAASAAGLCAARFVNDGTPAALPALTRLLGRFSVRVAA